MKAVKPLRVAVIGAGQIAICRHVPEAIAHSRAKLAMVCDLVIERAEKLAKPAGAKVCTDWHEVIASKDVDAVVVALPNYLHAPVTIAALQAGKHVLCEKPMATSAAETAAMNAAAKQSGKTLMIAHNQRLAPMHVRAKEILQSGILGRVVTFHTMFCHGGPEGWSVDGAGSWFFQKEKAFVGAMGDLGVHKADFTRWFLGEEVVEVAAFVDAIAGKVNSTVDDNALCLFRMESGTMGVMEASWSYNTSCDNGSIFHCEKGTLKIDKDPKYTVIVELTNGEKQFYQTQAMQTNDEGGQSDSGVMDAFVKCILDGTPCPIPGEEGAKSLDVVLACLESSATRRFVKVGEKVLA